MAGGSACSTQTVGQAFSPANRFGVSAARILYSEVVPLTATSPMRQLVESLQELEDRLRQGGGAAKIEKQHRDGKLTARERIAQLLDPGAMFLEVGLLIAYDQYDGQAPAAGVVTGVGKIEGRPAVIVANDATVKAGAWWPETITKILRAQEIAMRNRVPIVYLVDSAGVNLPLQDGIFPGNMGRRAFSTTTR